MKSTYAVKTCSFGVCVGLEVEVPIFEIGIDRAVWEVVQAILIRLADASHAQ